jgi:hypothetical protein
MVRRSLSYRACFLKRLLFLTGDLMRWNHARPDWEELTRRVHRRWSAISFASLAQVHGNRSALVGLISRLSHLSSDQANRELDEIEQRCRMYFQPPSDEPQSQS